MSKKTNSQIWWKLPAAGILLNIMIQKRNVGKREIN
jgi:hypothetical protein